MKKYLILIIVAIFMYSCGEFGSPAEKYAKITGKFPNNIIKKVKLVKDDPYEFGYQGIVVDSATVDSAGFFSIDFMCGSDEKYRLEAQEGLRVWGIFICPEDSMHIDIKSSEQGLDYDISGKGDGVVGTKLVRKFFARFKKDNEFYSKIYSDSLSEFISFSDNLRNEELNYFEKNFQSNDVPKIVKSEILDFINYDWAYNRIYNIMLNYYWGDKNPASIPKNYFNFLKLVTLDAPKEGSTFSATSPYRSFVNQYLHLLFFQWLSEQKKNAQEIDPIEHYIREFEIAKTKFTGLGRDIAMAESIADLIDYSGTKRYIELANKNIEELKKLVKDTGFVKPVVELYNRRTSLMPGKPAPELTLPDTTGKLVSLSDFKGKLVYLDFWGSWCSPCVQELPHIIKLQEKLADRKDFVYISVAVENKNLDNWKRFVEGYKLKGIHLYMEGGWTNPFAKKYMITGVPAYMIIGKNGIINTSNAMRPSQEGIEEYLRKLLNNEQ